VSGEGLEESVRKGLNVEALLNNERTGEALTLTDSDGSWCGRSVNSLKGLIFRREWRAEPLKSLFKFLVSHGEERRREGVG